MSRRMLALILLAGCFLGSASAQPPCADALAEILSAEGPLELRRSGAQRWEAAAVGAQLCPGDMVRSGSYARAALRLPDETILRLNQDTTLRFPPAAAQAPSLLELLRGTLHAITRTPRRLDITTPYVNAAVEGTEFTVAVQADRTRLGVVEGTVLASNPRGSLRVSGGQAVVATATTPPTPTPVARLRDAVAWALYYPPIADPGIAARSEQPAWREARQHLQRGQPGAALQALEEVPAPARDARYHVYRASLLLHTGQVTAAREEIARGERLAPGTAPATALRSVLALVEGDPRRSMELARAAVQQDPQSSAAWVALSYAWQARFDLEQALSSARHAVAAQPDDALAHARVAELQLASGRVEAARLAASEAGQRNPALARSQTVLGFAHLVEGDTVQALERFQQATTLDQGDPLPRLGLGLARIRRGNLAEGREDLELAVALDPGASLLRSYLGKAYYEEKRDPLAGDQYQLAQRLDPHDPTPWFYDALLQQANNRPGAALQDLQQSIDRNDNRMVYSSRLALDQDAAARAAAQARIYDELGFEQRATFEAARSLAQDPANAAAHRFLAQAVADRPRHEIARASEVLQSQLLQPLSLNPVPPSFAESDLNILRGAGPSVARLNEYSPLFVRDQTVLRAVGIIGNHGTRGDELTLAGVAENTAWSVGQFHYETDGFRPNADLEEDIYDAFVQTELSSRSSLQFEARARRQENGDLRLRFEPDDFSSDLDERRDEDTLRVGYRHRLAPGQQIIASLIYRHSTFANESTRVVSPFGPLGPIVLAEQDDTRGDTLASELQYLGRHGGHDLVIGGGYYRSEIEKDEVLRVTSGPLLLAESPDRSDRTDRGANLHGYALLELTPALRATVGMSAESVKLGAIDREQLNPKLGLEWQIAPGTVLRAAALRTLKRELVANQTVEPTQVAGFNQFFDDPTGSDGRRYGVGFDQRLGETLYGGLEWSIRDLEVPHIAADGVSVTTENQDEQLHRAYLYWLATPRLALALDVYYEDFERDDALLNQPASLTTWRVPVTLSYHHGNGLFAKLIPTYFDQTIDRPSRGRDDDQFWVVDAQVGYRLPRRLGAVSVGIHNLFDTEFNYYDADFQSGLQRPPIVQPERGIFVKAALSWD